MNTVQKRNFRYIFIFIAFLFLCLTPFALRREKAFAENAVYEMVYVGDVIEAEQHEITCDNGSVKAEGLTAVYPSGGVYGGDKITITQAGKYQVTYHATVDGQRVEETRYYMAARMPKDVIVAEEGMQVDYGKYEVESPYEMKNETYGAVVTFKEGQSITFNTKVKTAKLTKDYNLFELIVMPSVFKETDFERLTIRVTDAEDEANYVDVVVNTSNIIDGGGQVSYVQAGANGQLIGGYEGERFHSNSPLYGTQVEHSFRALAHEGLYRQNHTISENFLTLAIDNKDKTVYCGPYSNEQKSNVEVNDLDNPVRYKANPWGGFTSEDVTVKITAEHFVKSDGKVLIKSFGDLDFSQAIQDTVAPQLFVDVDESKALPIAEVGKDFPIFPFIAKDALDAQLKTNVFVYYVDGRGQKLTVENDGRSFFAKYAGDYQIVYRAEDYSGNVTEKVLEIRAQETIPNIYVAIEEPFMEAAAYQTISIPTAAQMYAFGGCGDLKVERAVYDPNNQKVEAQETLQLAMLGEYKVVYTVRDYLDNVGYGVITVRSIPVEKPSFIVEPSLNSVLIKGFTYDLPIPFVIETINGQILQVPYKAYVNDKLVENSFVAQGESMEIRYVAEGESGVSEWEQTVSVVDTEYGKYKSKYFHTEGDVQILDEKTCVNLLFSEDCSAEFITPLCSQDFRLTLSCAVEKTNFNAMVITLTDAVNSNLSVSLRLFYSKEENSWFIQLNNSINRFLYATSKDILTFALTSDTKGIIDTSGGVLTTISAYDNGNAFEGFSETIYLGIFFEGVEEESSISITQICNQPMGYNKSSLDKALDEVKPIILLDEAFILRQKLGAQAKIPTAKAYDVLGQIQELSVSIETPSGQILGGGDAREALTFTLDKAGYYLVTYYAKDSNGNKTSLPYTIFVSDEIAPTLEVKNDLKKEYQVGSEIKIPSYTAKDNGENCYVQVTVILPNNEMRLLEYNENGKITSLLSKDNELYENAFKAGDDAFVALQKGRYVLRIVAYDEYYNTTVKEIEFLVK